MAEGMLITAEATFVSVIRKKEGTNARGNPWTLYACTTHEGTEWATFDGKLANEVHSTVGRPVRIHGKAEQNGNFTNYKLEAIELIQPATPGQAAIAAAIPPAIPAAAPQIPAAVTTGTAGAASPAPLGTLAPEVAFHEYAAHADKTEAHKTRSIHRQTAAKVAAQLSDNASEFWENVPLIVKFFEDGDVPDAYVRVVGGQVADRYQHTDNDVPPQDEVPF